MHNVTFDERLSSEAQGLKEQAKTWYRADFEILLRRA
jgi:hypothetical protein